MNTQALKRRIFRLEVECLVTMYTQVDALAREVYLASYQVSREEHREALQRIDGEVLSARAEIQKGLDEDLLCQRNRTERKALIQEVKRRLLEVVDDWSDVLNAGRHS